MKWRSIKPRSSEREFSQSVDEHQQQLKVLCENRDTRWYTPYRLKLNVWLFLLLITSMSNGFDGSMMNGLQTLATWSDYFGRPEGGQLGLLNAIQNIGNLAGLPFAPYLNDHLGRKWTLFLGCCFMILATALQTASQSTGMFLASRFFIGFGNSWASISAPIWLTELAFPTHRAPLTSMYNSMWYLGSIVAAWTTFGTFVIPNTWSWRIPSLVQGVPPLLQMLLIFWIPESPRWLVSKGRDEQAIRILAKYHCHGDDSDPLVAFEYDDIQQTLAMERAVAAPSSFKTLRQNGFTPGNIKTAFVTSSWTTLFTDRCNLRRFRIIIALAFFSQWSGNGIVSYYLNIVLRGIGITESFDQLLFNGCLQIYNLITALVGALTVERAGRRTLFITSAAGMCMTYMVWTILSAKYTQSATTFNSDGDPVDGNAAMGRAVAFCIFIYYGFYNIAMSPLIVSYTVEILPYRIRSKGLMVFQVFVSAALVFNQYVNPIALGALGWRYYIVYTCWLAFETVYLFFTVVETKGKNGSPLPLEEIARLFDGDEARPDINPEDVRRQSDGTVLAGVPSNEKKQLDGAGLEHVETMDGGADMAQRRV